MLVLETVTENEFLTRKYCPVNKFIWNEWRGTIESKTLREAMIVSCEFIIENEVELILADFTKMSAPTLEDQVWIATHTAEILKDSKLRKVANLMASDFFQRIAIESIYKKASSFPLPCESRDFISFEDGMEWLFEGKEMRLF